MTNSLQARTGAAGGVMQHPVQQLSAGSWRLAIGGWRLAAELCGGYGQIDLCASEWADVNWGVVAVAVVIVIAILLCILFWLFVVICQLCSARKVVTAFASNLLRPPHVFAQCWTYTAAQQGVPACKRVWMCVSMCVQAAQYGREATDWWAHRWLELVATALRCHFQFVTTTHTGRFAKCRKVNAIRLIIFYL